MMTSLSEILSDKKAIKAYEHEAANSVVGLLDVETALKVGFCTGVDCLAETVSSSAPNQLNIFQQKK